MQKHGRKEVTLLEKTEIGKGTKFIAVSEGTLLS